MTNISKTMEERAVEAMHYTWNAIGHDLEAAHGGEQSLDDETLRDVIPDCSFMESHGHDDEAVKWFRALDYETRQTILLKAFPH